MSLTGPSSRMARLTRPRAGRPLNTLVTTVLSSQALRSAARCGGNIFASGQNRNAVPIWTAAAPSVSAAAMRAFIGEPGEAGRETLASASQAAAAGGVTTIICQPDTSPAIDNPATVDYVLRRARDTGIVHVHPMAAITKGLEGKEMTEIGLLKAAGAVAFTDGAKSVTNAQVMRRALTYAGDFDALIVHHVEDPNLVGDGVMNEGEFAARLGLLGIPKAAETIMLWEVDARSNQRLNDIARALKGADKLIDRKSHV